MSHAQPSPFGKADQLLASSSWLWKLAHELFLGVSREMIGYRITNKQLLEA
jgi:hypothetical protein